MNNETSLSHEEAAEFFGVAVEPVPPDEQEMEIVLVLRKIRAMLAEAAQEDEVGNNQLASRLKISPSVVSRLLRSEGDMRVSSAVLCAHALGRSWSLKLHKRCSSDLLERTAGLDAKVIYPPPPGSQAEASSGAIISKVSTLDRLKKKKEIVSLFEAVA